MAPAKKDDCIDDFPIFCRPRRRFDAQPVLTLEHLKPILL